MSGKDKGYEFTRIVRVSGEDATPTDGATSYSSRKTNFVVDFGYNLQQVKRVSVLSVSFLNTAFNIIDEPGTRSNNTFTIELDDGGTVTEMTYTIEPGFYNITQLMTVLNDAIVEFKTANPLSPTSVVFTQNSVSGYVQMTSSSLAAGRIWSVFDSDSKGNQTSRGPLQIMGFPLFRLSTALAGGTQTASELPHLQGLTEVNVVSQALAPSNCFDEKTQATSVLVVVPVTAPFGVLNVFECKQDVLCEVTYPSSRNIQRADFSLRDRFGELIDLNGSNLKLTLRVWFNTV